MGGPAVVRLTVGTEAVRLLPQWSGVRVYTVYKNLDLLHLLTLAVYDVKYLVNFYNNAENS